MMKSKAIWLAASVLAVCAGAAAVRERNLVATAPAEDTKPAAAATSSTAKATAAKYAVTIRKPAGPPRVSLGAVDATGQPATAACSTCHTTRPANLENRSQADLDEFHQTLGFAHGSVTCFSCHNPDDYDTLRLADGRSLPYTDVMTLCGQCHGTQMRDYRHGAHGGMNGYWDLSRGPRTRNNCIDCHDPHAPQFPAMQPTFKPRDRFLDSRAHTGATDHE